MSYGLSTRAVKSPSGTRAQYAKSTEKRRDKWVPLSVFFLHQQSMGDAPEDETLYGLSNQKVSRDGGKAKGDLGDEKPEKDGAAKYDPPKSGEPKDKDEFEQARKMRSAERMRMDREAEPREREYRARQKAKRDEEERILRQREAERLKALEKIRKEAPAPKPPEPQAQQQPPAQQTTTAEEPKPDEKKAKDTEKPAKAKAKRKKRNGSQSTVEQVLGVGNVLPGAPGRTDGFGQTSGVRVGAQHKTHGVMGAGNVSTVAVPIGSPLRRVAPVGKRKRRKKDEKSKQEWLGRFNQMLSVE